MTLLLRPGWWGRPSEARTVNRDDGRLELVRLKQLLDDFGRCANDVLALPVLDQVEGLQGAHNVLRGDAARSTTVSCRPNHAGVRGQEGARRGDRRKSHGLLSGQNSSTQRPDQVICEREEMPMVPLFPLRALRRTLQHATTTSAHGAISQPDERSVPHQLQ